MRCRTRASNEKLFEPFKARLQCARSSRTQSTLSEVFPAQIERSAVTRTTARTPIVTLAVEREPLSGRSPDRASCSRLHLACTTVGNAGLFPLPPRAPGRPPDPGAVPRPFSLNADLQMHRPSGAGNRPDASVCLSSAQRIRNLERNHHVERCSYSRCAIKSPD